MAKNLEAFRRVWEYRTHHRVGFECPREIDDPIIDAGRNGLADPALPERAQGIACGGSTANGNRLSVRAGNTDVALTHRKR